MKKAILFDLDGTLLNTDLLIKKSFIHLKNTNQTILYLKKNFYHF